MSGTNGKYVEALEVVANAAREYVRASLNFDYGSAFIQMQNALNALDQAKAVTMIQDQ